MRAIFGAIAITLAIPALVVAQGWSRVNRYPTSYYCLPGATPDENSLQSCQPISGNQLEYDIFIARGIMGQNAALVSGTNSKIDGVIAALNAQTEAAAALSTQMEKLAIEIKAANDKFGQGLRSELLNRFDTLPMTLATDETAFGLLKDRLMTEVDAAMTARGVPPKP